MQAKEMKKVQRRAPVAYVEKKVKETCVFSIETEV
jgi:hypothetical protein